MLIETGPEFQGFEGWDQKANVYKKEPEYQCLEGENENGNAYKNRVIISMFGRVGKNFNVCSGRIR